MKRFIALVISIVLVLSSATCVSFASSTSGTYGVKVIQNYKQAQNFVKKMNKARSKKGLSTVKLDEDLTKGAIQRAAEVSLYVPSSSPHMRPNGKKASTISKKQYGECCLEYSWECTNAGNALSEWLDSPTHKKVIMTKGLKSVGVSCATIPGIDGYFTIWVLEVSKSKAGKVVKTTKEVEYNKKVTILNKNTKKPKFKVLQNYYYSEEDYEQNEQDYYDYCDYFEELGLDYNDYDGERTLIPGKTKKYNAFYYPGGSFFYVMALPSYVQWTSSKPSVATVDKNGKITGVSKGKTKITAKLKNGTKKSASVTIEVF